MINADELMKALGTAQAAPTRRRRSITADQVHEHAVTVLHTLRGLAKGDKRRVLKKAEKLLDS